MLTAIILASFFIFMGISLILSARKAIATGKAEPDDMDAIYRKIHRYRFSLFVAVQFLFGCLIVLAGIALAAVAVYSGL